MTRTAKLALAVTSLLVGACGTGEPRDAGARDAALSARDGSLLDELGAPAATTSHSGSVVIGLGTGWPEHACFSKPPTLTLWFFDQGDGVYTAKVGQPRCSAPDGGMPTLCDHGLEAKLGSTYGAGTARIARKTSSDLGTWGGFEVEVDLAFEADGGVRSVAFGFSAPICGLE